MKKPTNLSPYVSSILMQKLRPDFVLILNYNIVNESKINNICLLNFKIYIFNRLVDSIKRDINEKNKRY